MICELLGLDDLDAPFLEEWDTLGACAVEPNPFFEAPFLLPALAHLDPGRRVRLLVVRDGTRILMLVPVVHERWWKRLPIHALVGWRHNQCFLGTPLARGDALSSAVAVVSEQLQRRRFDAQLLVLSWSALDGPVMAEFSAARGRSAPLTLDSFERPVLRRNAGGESELRLGQGTRRRLAERWRQLERELGTTQLIDHAEDVEAHVRFLELEASGWKGERGSAMAADPLQATFFRELAAGFAAQGRLELYSLETIDGTTLAMSVRLRAGAGTFSFKVAHDEKFRKYAPGRQLELLLLKALEEGDDLEWVDSCAAPGNEFLEALFADRLAVGNALITTTTGWRANMVGALPTMRRWRQKAQATP